MTDTSVLTLAHLSDVHLAPLPRLSAREWNAKRALGAANWHRNRRDLHVRSVLDRLTEDLARQQVDHIAVTGDLVNLGLPAEHAAALDWLRALGPPERVSVVPGNHDVYVRMRGDPGHLRWKDYMASPTEPPGEDRFPYVRRLGRVALIGAGSGVPTPLFVSSGHLGSRQRAVLADRLEALGAEGLFRIVLIHHPPYRYPMAWRTGLRDAEHVEELLRRHGAELVLHGHFHRNLMRWIERRPSSVPMIGVPSASAARDGHGDLAAYNILRIAVGDDAPAIEMITRGLAAPDGPVVELGRRKLTA